MYSIAQNMTEIESRQSHGNGCYLHEEGYAAGELRSTGWTETT